MPNSGIRIESLTRDIGAEIHGLDLRQPLTGESFEFVYRALPDNLVMELLSADPQRCVDHHKG